MKERPRILLVDDDEDLLRLLALRLRAAGYEVHTAESGEAALVRLPQARPELVITDLRMGGMDGMALYEAIRQENRALPVIILTAHGSIPEAVEATRRGVYSFLTKPFDGKALLGEVQRALELSGAGPREGEGAEDHGWRRDIVTRSPRIEELLRKARLAADGDASVLLCGESGTGKELLARAIHRASPRRDRPFVALNCGAIPEPLLESELFGHVRGAFTGAVRDHAGLFQSADGGTVFLDEIGDMPSSLQVKLLRVLQDREVRPVGASGSARVDVRVVSATHRDLEAEIAAGTFREDLYYRINVIRLDICRLAERREDVPLLAEHFLAQFVEKGRKKVTGFSPEAMEALVAAPWPGNVRQLANVVEQVYTLTTSRLIPVDLVNEAIRCTSEGIPSLVEARRRFELDYLLRVLKIAEGNVSRAARLAGRNRTDFYKLLARHEIDPALFKAAAR